MSEIPRRNRVDQWTPAEHAIDAAVQVVEALPADVRLTDAVVRLGEARNSVADYVDGVGKTPEPQQITLDDAPTIGHKGQYSWEYLLAEGSYAVMKGKDPIAVFVGQDAKRHLDLFFSQL